MPKVTNTRAQRAKELIDLVSRGPSFSDSNVMEFTPAAAADCYRLWASMWVAPLLAQLVPELQLSNENKLNQLNPKGKAS